MANSDANSNAVFKKISETVTRIQTSESKPRVVVRSKSGLGHYTVRVETTPNPLRQPRNH